MEWSAWEGLSVIACHTSAPATASIFIHLFVWNVLRVFHKCNAKYARHSY